jgi:hypothetical protein
MARLRRLWTRQPARLLLQTNRALGGGGGRALERDGRRGRGLRLRRRAARLAHRRLVARRGERAQRGRRAAAAVRAHRRALARGRGAARGRDGGGALGGGGEIGRRALGLRSPHLAVESEERCTRWPHESVQVLAQTSERVRARAAARPRGGRARERDGARVGVVRGRALQRARQRAHIGASLLRLREERVGRVEDDEAAVKAAVPVRVVAHARGAEVLAQQQGDLGGRARGARARGCHVALEPRELRLGRGRVRLADGPIVARAVDGRAEGGEGAVQRGGEGAREELGAERAEQRLRARVRVEIDDRRHLVQRGRAGRREPELVAPRAVRARERGGRERGGARALEEPRVRDAPRRLAQHRRALRRVAELRAERRERRFEPVERSAHRLGRGRCARVLVARLGREERAVARSLAGGVELGRERFAELCGRGLAERVGESAHRHRHFARIRCAEMHPALI